MALSNELKKKIGTALQAGRADEAKHKLVLRNLLYGHEKREMGAGMDLSFEDTASNDPHLIEADILEALGINAFNQSQDIGDLETMKEVRDWVLGGKKDKNETQDQKKIDMMDEAEVYAMFVQEMSDAKSKESKKRDEQTQNDTGTPSLNDYRTWLQNKLGDKKFKENGEKYEKAARQAQLQNKSQEQMNELLKDPNTREEVLKDIREVLSPESGQVDPNEFRRVLDMLRLSGQSLGYKVDENPIKPKTPGVLHFWIDLGQGREVIRSLDFKNEQSIGNVDTHGVRNLRERSGRFFNRNVSHSGTAQATMAINQTGSNLATFIAAQLGFDEKNWRPGQEFEVGAYARDLLLEAMETTMHTKSELQISAQQHQERGKTA